MPPTPQRPERWLLVIDDDPADIELVTIAAALLDDVSCRVSAREGGRDGLADLAERRHPDRRRLPDMCLVDLCMSEPSGFDVLAAVRADPLLDEMPVVVLMASASPSDAERARCLGADDAIVKPGDLDGYVALLRRALATIDARARRHL